jgi:hypothetical protein
MAACFARFVTDEHVVNLMTAIYATWSERFDEDTFYEALDLGSDGPG